LSNAYPFAGAGRLYDPPHRRGERHCRERSGYAVSTDLTQERKTMSALRFSLCLVVCAVVGLLIGIVAGNAHKGFTTGLAAGAAIASVLIALTDEPT
jgi:hypothetical protein